MARHTATVCFPSPVGTIDVEANMLGITRVRLGVRGKSREVGEGRAIENARQGRSQILAFLGGDLREFSVAIVFDGTPFQRSVWGELQRVPYGATKTYGEIALALGRPRAARAVGTACGANPLPLLVPCHRIVGCDGSLVGFGGGIEVKRYLLAMEKASTA